MPTNFLASLRTMTTVVADTGDFDSVQRFQPQDATTNPSLITAAARLPRYQQLVDEVLGRAKEELGDRSTDEQVANLAFRRLAVAFGHKLLGLVPGRVSTEVDARVSFDRDATVRQARDIIGQYDRLGVARDRILIKIAATWAGIQAAGQLEREGIHCNLTLVFGLHQAIACAEANVTLISPFVGRILDWYQANKPGDYAGPNDPGVRSVTTIYNYIKKFGYKTVVMGASFRNLAEITELAGCDLLTISPRLLEELENQPGELGPKLSRAGAQRFAVERISMDETTFERWHREDRMAHEKLTEGINGFGAALVELERLLARRLTELGANNQPVLAAS